MTHMQSPTDPAQQVTPAQDTIMQTIIIVGYGAMARAITYGLSRIGKYHLEMCGRDVSKAQMLINEFALKNATAIALESSSSNQCDSSHNTLESTQGNALSIDIQDKIVFLCVKPYGLGSFHYVGQARAVYSVLAGVSVATLQSHISAQAYIRLMPNVAASQLDSATAAFCVNADMKQAQEICESFGSVVFVEDEKLIDASIATSGSSPAFLALIAQALVDSGVRAGLKREDSFKLVARTFEGVGLLMHLENRTPQEIIDMVTTPGGTTIEGLAVLESSGVRGAIMRACQASVSKAATSAQVALDNPAQDSPSKESQ